jgi:hypothetical protein
MAKPWDASLADSNSIHGPSAQNRWHSTRKFLEIYIVSMILADSNFSWPWDHFHWKDYLLIFPCICRSPKLEVECILYVNLKARWSWTLNWLRPPPCCPYFFRTIAPSWCPTCHPWSTPWFLITIKSLGSHLFSISLAGEHKNEFTWRRSCCARDLIIGPCTSIGVDVSGVVMSSAGSSHQSVISYINFFCIALGRVEVQNLKKF